MTTFEIRWTESSFRKLQKLDSSSEKRIIERLDEAAVDPYSMSKKLTGVNLYSVN